MQPAIFTPIQWHQGRLRVLDQRYLPDTENWLELDTVSTVCAAIRDMAVRGAPAIGIAAAYGVVLSAYQHCGTRDWRDRVRADMAMLKAARPTAVNLDWALVRMRAKLDAASGPDLLLQEAVAIQQEDLSQNLQMAEIGSNLITRPCSVITHCNTGALATGGHGTALGVIRSAYAAGKIRHVYATETRPWLQGARLTVWELAREHIPVTLITDSAAGTIMASEKPAWLITGADRITANGDVANKIGTYSLAVLARHHGIRVMVVAPSSTIDMKAAGGGQVPIENRSGQEVWSAASNRPPPEGISIANPAFDITPAALVDELVTENGYLSNPDARKMENLFGKRD